MILFFAVYVEGSEYKKRVCEKSCAGDVKKRVIKTLVQHVGTPTQVPVTLRSGPRASASAAIAEAIIVDINCTFLAESFHTMLSIDI